MKCPNDNNENQNPQEPSAKEKAEHSVQQAQEQVKQGVEKFKAMPKKKQIIFGAVAGAALIACSAFTLTGCGKKSEPPAEPAAAQKAEPRLPSMSPEDFIRRACSQFNYNENSCYNLYYKTPSNGFQDAQTRNKFQKTAEQKANFESMRRAMGNPENIKITSVKQEKDEQGEVYVKVEFTIAYTSKITLTGGRFDGKVVESKTEKNASAMITPVQDEWKLISFSPAAY